MATEEALAIADRLSAAAERLHDGEHAGARLCPEPLRFRLEERAATCDRLAGRHESDRVTVASSPSEPDEVDLDRAMALASTAAAAEVISSGPPGSTT